MIYCTDVWTFMALINKFFVTFKVFSSLNLFLVFMCDSFPQKEVAYGLFALYSKGGVEHLRVELIHSK